MGLVHELNKKLKEKEDLIEEYQLKMKEWEERHEQKVRELERLISNLRKNISKQADKMRSQRLERISETLEIKRQMREKNSQYRRW